MQQKLSQEQLAAKAQLLGCDLTRSALAKIECGQQSIYPDELKALHLALDRAYQAQKVDMLDTSEKVCQIRTEIEEALERENADTRE